MSWFSSRCVVAGRHREDGYWPDSRVMVAGRARPRVESPDDRVVVVNAQGSVPGYRTSEVVVAGRGRKTYVWRIMSRAEAVHVLLAGLHRRAVL